MSRVVASAAACDAKRILKDFNVDKSLVDPASSHMLVSKIKPCMSKSKLCLHGETADGSLNQSWSKWASSFLLG